MSLPRDDTERQLTQKLQMTLRNRKGDDHRRYELVINGRRVVRTMVSRGSGHRTLSNDIVSKMAKQLQVTTPFFREVIICTKSREDYLEKLREQELIN